MPYGGLLCRVAAQVIYLQCTTDTEKSCTHIHTLGCIRTNDPSVGMIYTAALNYEANVLCIVNLAFNKCDDKQRKVATQQRVQENVVIGEPGETPFHCYLYQQTRIH